jgi:kelch-like protein 20
MPVEICLEDVDAASMEQIIEFCYTSSICVSEDNVYGLLPTATRLQMTELCTLCSDFLRSGLTRETAMMTYLTAVRCAITDLAHDTQHILKDSLDEVRGQGRIV